MPSQSQSSAVRYALGGLLAFGALNAFAGGLQVAILGYVSWMQPATAIGGVLILLLAWLLPPPGLPSSES
jgi:uncharacterized membrane protein YgdD (TMEM256/DUF423 family)